MRPTKITPAIVRAAFKHANKGMTAVASAALVGLEASTVRKLRTGTFGPNAPYLAAWEQTFGRALAAKRVINRDKPARSPANMPGNTSGAPQPQNAATAPNTPPPFGNAKKLAPAVSQTAGAVSRPEVNPPEKEDPMLLVNQPLSQATLAHFGLAQNPFADDVQSSDDVFQTPSVRFVRHALLDAALHHGFVALTGESGAGKSTMAEDLEERIRRERRDIVVIRPYVLGMEENDTKGKTLKSGAIAAAIVAALDPTATVRQTPQARFRQVHELLRTSFASGRRHLLLIEEAHGLPTATLKHLKRFLELKDGMRRLLGVALIGQPELCLRLDGTNAELREVTQRCAQYRLEPLDAELEGYLAHKLARCGQKLADVFAPDAADALRQRLTYTPRGGKPADMRSLCYPLMVNNLVARAMTACAELGYPIVDASAVHSV